MIPTILWLKERLCRKLSNKGFATIWYLIAVVVIVFMASFVISESYAETQQDEIKTAMNRAVKAATMQYDKDILSNEAKIVIPEDQANLKFKEYLEDNLKLDNSLKPTEGSVFQNKFQLITFKVVDQESLPYTAEVTEAKFSHTFKNPGVMAVIKTTVNDVWGTGETTYYVPAVAEVNLEVSGGDGT